jgi:hypothetical protein
VSFSWLSALAVDLVQRRVAVIITLDTVPAARAAKTVTTGVPIVFTVGTDPVQAGLVARLNQPGGNVTGISTMNLDLAPKWVGLLRELQPSAKRFAVLVNIANAGSARSLITGTGADHSSGHAAGPRYQPTGRPPWRSCAQALRVSPPCAPGRHPHSVSGTESAVAIRAITSRLGLRLPRSTSPT